MTSDPLPAYTPPHHPSDTDSSSIHSAAPSYHSTLPPNHSSLLSTPQQPPPPPPPPPPPRRTSTLLPSRVLPPVSDLSAHTFHAAHNPWTPVSSTQSRHYHSVAARRASSSRSSIKSHTPSLSSSSSTSSTASVSPHEDPHLVGETAAAEARARRLIMSRDEGEAVLRREDAKWDFLIAQMGDWEERERSWGVWRGRAEMRQQKRVGGWRGRVGL